MILQLRTKTHIILSVKIHECHNNYASPLWYNMSGIGGLRLITITFRPISEKLYIVPMYHICIKNSKCINVRKEESLKTPLKTKYGSVGISDATFIALPQQGNADQTKATT